MQDDGRQKSQIDGHGLNRQGFCGCEDCELKGPLAPARPARHRPPDPWNRSGEWIEIQLDGSTAEPDVFSRRKQIGQVGREPSASNGGQCWKCGRVLKPPAKWSCCPKHEVERKHLEKERKAHLDGWRRDIREKSPFPPEETNQLVAGIHDRNAFLAARGECKRAKRDQSRIVDYTMPSFFGPVGTGAWIDREILASLRCSEARTSGRLDATALTDQHRPAGMKGIAARMKPVLDLPSAFRFGADKTATVDGVTHRVGYFGLVLSALCRPYVLASNTDEAWKFAKKLTWHSTAEIARAMRDSPKSVTCKDCRRVQYGNADAPSENGAGSSSLKMIFNHGDAHLFGKRELVTEPN